MPGPFRIWKFADCGGPDSPNPSRESFRSNARVALKKKLCKCRMMATNLDQDGVAQWRQRTPASEFRAYFPGKNSMWRCETKDMDASSVFAQCNLSKRARSKNHTFRIAMSMKYSEILTRPKPAFEVLANRRVVTAGTAFEIRCSAVPMHMLRTCRPPSARSGKGIPAFPSFLIPRYRMMPASIPRRV